MDKQPYLKLEGKLAKIFGRIADILLVLTCQGKCTECLQLTNRTCFPSVLFRLVRSRRPSGPRPFQRLQVDYDDDDPLLEWTSRSWSPHTNLCHLFVLRKVLDLLHFNEWGRCSSFHYGMCVLYMCVHACTQKTCCFKAFRPTDTCCEVVHWCKNSSRTEWILYMSLTLTVVQSCYHRLENVTRSQLCFVQECNSFWGNTEESWYEDDIEINNFILGV